MAKQPKLSEITSKFDTLNRIGSSIVNRCDRNNVFANYELKYNRNNREDVTLIIEIVGYADSGIKEFWQDKINPSFTLDVNEREEDNHFFYTITIQNK